MSAKHIHRTAVFTLHNPTRHVRAVLDHALEVYTHAYTVALQYFAEYTIEELQAMATYAIDDHGQPLMSDRQLAHSLLRKETIPTIASTLQPLESSLRDALKVDVAQTLLSYVVLSLETKLSPSYPSRLPKQDVEPTRLASLAAIATLADNQDEENVLFVLLQKTKQAEVRSLSFNHIEPERGCGLFYNPDTQKFYARLFVVSPRSHYAKPLAMAGRYIDIRTGTIYMRDEDARKEQGIESFGKGKISILVPLEMGKWHEQMLRFTESAFLPQRTGEGIPAKPVSAKLVKHGEDYQLHVSFQFPKPTKIKTTTLLGIDRGITCLAAGAVTSKDGREVLEAFIVDGTELRALQRRIEENIRIRQTQGKVTKGDRRRAKIADHHIHQCANQIVELALKHQSQVVMEDLTAFASPHKRPKGQARSNFNRLLPRRQYQKLQDVLNAKLALVGLPPIRTVGAAFTSLTCTRCGNISKDNRSTEDRTQFHCAECGYITHADSQAGVNIARKLLWLSLRSQEKQAEIATDARTPWASFARTFKATS